MRFDQTNICASLKLGLGTLCRGLVHFMLDVGEGGAFQGFTVSDPPSGSKGGKGFFFVYT